MTDPLPWEIDEHDVDLAEHTAADAHLADERAEAYAADAPVCQWYALCTNRAEGVLPHKILGDVPTCSRCAAKHDQTLLPFPTAAEPVATDRIPYVGEGADGARRSAEIDRSEADGLDPGPRRDEVLASAAEWDRIADRLDLESGAVTLEPVPVEDDEEEVAADLAVFTPDALAHFLAIRDPRQIAPGASALRDELVAQVRGIVDEALATVPENVGSSTDLRPAATRLADLAELLEAVGGAFSTAAREAKVATGELVTVLGHKIRVGDGYGSDLAVSLTARRELSVDDAALDDVLAAAVPYLIPGPKAAESLDYALGFRSGIEALRGVLTSSPGYRSTALDALVTKLENADVPEADALAKRLRAAYARVDKGEPTVKIERLEPKAPRK
jgi:hypothetical protein